MPVLSDFDFNVSLGWLLYLRVVKGSGSASCSDFSACSQVVTVKNKYIILNDTGLTIEYKQKGTPDPGSKTYEEYGKGRRFAGDLPHSARTAFHWDNKFLAQELVIRPLGKGWWVRVLCACWRCSSQVLENGLARKWLCVAIVQGRVEQNREEELWWGALAMKSLLLSWQPSTESDRDPSLSAQQIDVLAVLAFLSFYALAGHLRDCLPAPMPCGISSLRCLACGLWSRGFRNQDIDAEGILFFTALITLLVALQALVRQLSAAGGGEVLWAAHPALERRVRHHPCQHHCGLSRVCVGHPQERKVGLISYGFVIWIGFVPQSVVS
eukprot:1158605-Pelagomonas_calceolata.AAC.4